MTYLSIQSGRIAASPTSASATAMSGTAAWIASAAAFHALNMSRRWMDMGSFMSSAPNADGWSAAAAATRPQNLANLSRPAPSSSA